MKPQEYSPLLLAYLGDSVMEVLVREYLIGRFSTSADCNKEALSFVTAKSQSDAIRNNLDLLTEEERELFTRAKNAKSLSAPRNVDLYSYRLATGLEAIFGYHHLCGNEKRNRELFEALFFQK